MEEHEPQRGASGPSPNDPFDDALRAAYQPRSDAPEHRESVLAAIRRITGIDPKIQLREALEQAADPKNPGIKSGNGEQTGRYEILGEIARGGIGVVLKARDTDLGRDVALKVLGDDHLRKPEMTQRFMEEAQIGGQLQHPGIVPVYELGLQASDQPYFSMKLLQGETLAALLDARPKVSSDRHRFLGIFHQVCQAVAYAHARGVIHRDLKPANVMVGSFGEVQVIDWGLAKVMSQRNGHKPQSEPTGSPVDTVRSKSGSQSLSGSVMGTPAYMPPEQARGETEQLDERSDVFGLGAILCEILTGIPPFPGTTEESVRKKASEGDLTRTFTRLQKCGVDGELVRIAQATLAPEKEKRPENAQVVASQVSEYLASVEQRARAAELDAAEAEGRVAVEQRARTITTVLGVAIVLLLVGGGGAFFLTEQSRRDRIMATDTAISEALGETGRLRDDARAAGLLGDPTWQLADAAMSRAESLVAGGEATSAVVDRVLELRLGLNEEIEQFNLDRETAEALAGARSDSSGYPDIAVKDYREIFAKIDIDVEELPASEAGERIRKSAISQDLIRALHDWLRLAQTRNDPPVPPDRIAGILDAADLDPWRSDLRRLILAGEQGAEGLRGLADSDLSSRSPLDLDLLAEALKANRMHNRAIEVLLEGRQRHADDLRINLHLAQLLGGREDRIQEAMGYARVAMALRPQSATVRAQLASLHERLGETDLALQEYTEATRLRDDAYWSHIYIGRILEERGDLQGATEAYQSAVDIHPTYSMAALYLGEVQRRLEKWDEAVESFRIAVEEFPSIDAWLLVVESYQGGGRMAEALSELQKMLDMYPESVRIRFVLGEFQAELGDWDAALVTLTEALDVQSPNYDHVYTHHATLLRIDLLNLVGLLASQTGDFPLAISVLEELDELLKRRDEILPTDVEVNNESVIQGLSNLGHALMRSRRFEEAIDVLERGLEMGETNPMLHYNMAVSLQGQGSFQEAVPSMRRLHELTAGDPQTREFLRLAESFVGLAPQLETILNGELPTDPQILADLGALLMIQQRNAAAARLWRAAFAGNAALAGNDNRYNAACAAALAAAGVGTDADDLTREDRARIRADALDWLQEDLRSWRPRIEPGSPPDAFKWWIYDPDLAGVRDEDTLERMPAREAETWRAFWAEVHALIEGAG